MKPKTKWIALGIAGSAVIAVAVAAILIQRGDLGTDSVADLRQAGSDVIDTLADMTGVDDRRRDDDMDPETRAQIDAALAKLEGGIGDPNRGHAIFEERCIKCHVYNGEGQRVGPELTFTDRNNINKLLELIMDPSDYVREEYRATEFVVSGDAAQGEATQYITGFVLLENETHFMVTDTAAEVITIEKDRIEEQYPVMGSIMPDRLLDDLSDTQLRDLVTYLQEVPVPEDNQRDRRRGRDDDDEWDRDRWRDRDDDREQNGERWRGRDDQDEDADPIRWRDRRDNP